MNMPWFRLYREFATDPEVQMLAFEDQRHFVMCMCMKASGVLDKDYPSAERRERVLATYLGLDPVSAAEAKRRLREAGLVDANWHPVNWEKRQFRSDHDAAERKQRQREREKASDGRSSTTSDASGGRSSTTPDDEPHVTTMSRDSHGLDQNRFRTDSEQRESAGARADEPGMDAWREVSGVHPPALEQWLAYLARDFQKVPGGMQRIGLAKLLAGFGGPAQQTEVVNRCSANGWKNIRHLDGTSTDPGLAGARKIDAEAASWSAVRKYAREAGYPLEPRQVDSPESFRTLVNLWLRDNPQAAACG